jgi:hypothetical protein
MNDNTNSNPLPPNRFDLALDQLRTLIEALEAEQAKQRENAEIPTDVPRFEVF